MGQDGKFVEVFGQISTSQSSLSTVEIQIKEDAKPWLNVKFNKRNGEFNLALPLNHVFLFKFSQPGTVEKQIEFSTFCHEDYYDVEFAPFFFMVRLEDYTQTPELDTLFYSEPVGKIFFSEEFIKFDYNRDYNLYVKNKIAEVKQTIEEEKLLIARAVQDSINQAELLAQTTQSLIDTTKLNEGDSMMIAALLPDSNIQALETEEILAVEKDADSLLLVSENVISVDIEPKEQKKAEEIVEESINEIAPVNETITLAENKVETKIEPEKEQIKNDKEETKPAAINTKTEVRTQTTNATAKDPKPVSIGKPNGKEFDFKEYSDKQVTKVFITESRRTIIYSMFQYNNGRTRYYKQQPLTNDSIQISRDVFTKAIR